MTIVSEARIMTKEEHRQRHEFLHKAFDELLADFLMHNREARPSSSTLIELMNWSHQQTLDPTPLDGHLVKT